MARSAMLWCGAYLLLALLPLGIAVAIRPDEVREFGAELGAFLGFLALGVLACQAVISGRHRWFAESVGHDNILQFHRQTGIFALILVLAHPLVMLATRPAWIEYLDPREDTLRAITLILLLLAMLVLVASSLWRTRFGLSYEWWRALHGGLTLFVVAGGLGHAVMVQHYTQGVITTLALGALVCLSLLLVVESRLLRPWRLRQRPWKVVANEPERGDAATLTLEAAGGHRLDFAPGQFFWITVGETPFSLQQHPFSVASSSTDGKRFAFTAKRLGDFTNRLPDVTPGTRAFVEGPYGAFVPEPDNASGAVLIAGGIGVTPIMSILRSLRDQGDTRPLWLLYANKTWEDATFRDELSELEQTLDLDVIHVISDPEPEWSGERGKIDDALVRRRLPPDDGRREYFICGPEPLMDAAERALLKLGASPTRIYSDRFDIV
ncbi:ferredoxin reductase family protein [Halomonas kenyensis]|uniref:Ferredoxin reductase family protein n=1 Tax=Billgrantia kenyensis TaxID=321266 RepID=A0A7V9W1I0_9GAMM|nr:ferredoxin reductase family protein [Halomonas kenyensis]MCG6662538.1 ferredoxin reductase family protein [Halomonas kenyensis]